MHWVTLVNLSEADIATQDIAFTNIACAMGLPRALNMDPNPLNSVLDSWASRVAQETVQCAAQFRREPAQFENY
jgi:hypothetical protein